MGSKQDHKMVALLAVAAGAAALLSVVYTSFPWIDGRVKDTAGPEPRQSGLPYASTDLQYDIDDLVAAHLFGDPAEAGKTPDTTHAPETQLRLRLMGMISSGNQDFSRALIGVNSGEVSAYRVGEGIADTDAVVHSVDAGRVLLNRAGAMESLYLNLPRVTLGKPRSGQPVE